MATREELYTALRNADAAGDNEGAAKLAAYIQGMPSDAPSKPTLKQSNPAEYDSNSPEFQAKYGPTGTTAQNFSAGAGKSVADLGRGVKQIYANVADRVLPQEKTLSGLITGKQPSRSSAIQQEIDDSRQLDAPLMRTGAGVAGDVAGTLATTLIPGGGIAKGAEALNLGRTALAARALVNPTTYRAAAAAGAAQGALQPVATGESRLQNAALGAATGTVGQAAANTIGRIAQPLKRALKPEDAKAVDTLTDAGVPLDAAQRSGSKGAQVVKRAIADNPLTSPGQAAFVDKQQRAFTRAVLKTIGADSDAATQDVMGAAQAKIGQVFDDVASRNPVKYDGQLHQDIVDLSQQAQKELTPDGYAVLKSQIQDIYTKAFEHGGQIDGKAYQNLRSSLGRVSQQPGALGHWATELRSTIDDALQRSASSQDLTDLKNARLQYRRMKQIEGAVDTEGGGRISAAKLANALSVKSNRNQAVYGRGDQELVRLAQAGKKILPDKFPNSGTAARAATQLLAPAAVGLGIGTYTGDTHKGLGAAAGTAGLLLGARGAMNNQLVARYLSEGINPGAIRNVLAAPQTAGILGRQVPIATLQALRQSPGLNALAFNPQ